MKYDYHAMQSFLHEDIIFKERFANFLKFSFLFFSLLLNIQISSTRTRIFLPKLKFVAFFSVSTPRRYFLRSISTPLYQIHRLCIRVLIALYLRISLYLYTFHLTSFRIAQLARYKAEIKSTAASKNFVERQRKRKKTSTALVKFVEPSSSPRPSSSFEISKKTKFCANIEFEVKAEICQVVRHFMLFLTGSIFARLINFCLNLPSHSFRDLNYKDIKSHNLATCSINVFFTKYRYAQFLMTTKLARPGRSMPSKFRDI